MENLSHVVGEVCDSYIRMLQSYGAMFRDITPELEFFRCKDHPVLLPKMFFADVPWFPDKRST